MKIKAGYIIELSVIYLMFYQAPFSIGDPGAIRSISEANNNFALDLHQKLVESGQENVFFSPLSISLALAMTELGAAGNSSKQMKNVLHLNNLPENDSHGLFNDLLRNLQAHNNDRTSTSLRIANRLFLQDDYLVQDKFKNDLLKFYDSLPMMVNFAADPDNAREVINQWVQEVTENRINELVGPDTLDERTRLVLVNALYFKSDWLVPFERYITRKDAFHGSTGDKDVDMMYRQGTFAVGRVEELKTRILEMPYKGNKLKMVILLPDEMNGLGQLEETLTYAHLDQIGKATKNLLARIGVPKFTMEDSFSLSDVLQSLGMEEVFKFGKADLSGIDGTKQLYIDQVLHKTFIEVNEEGTEAAAATAVEILLGAVMESENPEMFVVDHPFLFFIKDADSDAILFMGRIGNPSYSPKSSAVDTDINFAHEEL